MFDWEKIDTVFLDMDGTLLNLSFDNYFWLDYVPLAFSRKRKIDLIEAKAIYAEKFQKISGKLDWYSIDYWTAELDLNIEYLQASQSSKISVLPNVVNFLDLLKLAKKKRVLVTNAHQISISLKMKKTKLNERLDLVVCSHDIGLAKEDPMFWEKFHQIEPYEADKILFIDDNLDVLNAAKAQGIENLLAISQPDLNRPIRKIDNFKSIKGFSELIPSLEDHIAKT